MSEKSNIQKMYEYQECKGKSDYEYVVRGAEVSCKYGSEICVLNLPRDHGVYTSDNRPLITVNDSKVENIRGFGICSKDRSKPCKCEPKLKAWSATPNMNLHIVDPITKKESYAVTQNSATMCEKGGIVSFKTSGQTSPSYKSGKIKNAVEIVEDVQGSWIRKADKKDFIGHVQVEHSGVYNFCISTNGIRYRDLGSVFVYRKNLLGWILYIGAYKLEERFKENGSSELYVEIVLDRGENYYIEVDTPDMNKINYELRGNLDRHRLKVINSEKKEISGVWIIDKEYEKLYPDHYEKAVKERHHGITRSIYYLNPWYAMLLANLISEIIGSGERPNMVNNILNIGITLWGVKDTAAGVVMSALLLGLDNFSNYELKRFSEKLNKAKGENSYLKIEIKSNDYAGEWIYQRDTPIIFDNDYYYIFSECQKLDIGVQLEGEKYEKGRFELLYNFDSDTNPQDLINELKQKASNIQEIR